MTILGSEEIPCERSVWSTAQRKKSNELMLMLGLSETIEQLAMANRFHKNGHLLRRENAHDLISILHLEVGG